MNPTQRRTAGLVVAGASLLAFIGNWEGDEKVAFADKLAGGLPTVCNGHTGPEVRVGDVWTKPQCDAILRKDVEHHGAGILTCITVPLNQNEYEAYASLAFNNGVSAVCNSSIPGKLAAGERVNACNTILEFNKVRDYSKPKVWNARTKKMEYPLIPVRGLTLRRTAEHKICLTPVAEPIKALAINQFKPDEQAAV